jgi:hypothetical protein
VEIKDIIINDRDECTFKDPNTSPGSLAWLEGGSLDDNDRHQLWLHQANEDAVNALKPTQNGKYNVCHATCPDGKKPVWYARSPEPSGYQCVTGVDAPFVKPTPVCEKSSVQSFDQITLNVGDYWRWIVNKQCQKVIRAKVVTDRGTNEYNFTQ